MYPGLWSFPFASRHRKEYVAERYRLLAEMGIKTRYMLWQPFTGSVQEDPQVKLANPIQVQT